MAQHFASRARVIETRVNSLGHRTRIYQEPTGFRFDTVEVPAAVVRTFSKAQLKDATERALRGLMNREATFILKKMVASQPKVSASKLAEIIGVSEARVRQIRKGLK